MGLGIGFTNKKKRLLVLFVAFTIVDPFEFSTLLSQDVEDVFTLALIFRGSFGFSAKLTEKKSIKGEIFFIF